MPHAVLNVAELPHDALRALLARYDLQLQQVGIADSIPGSFWGETEAGLMDGCLHVRADTPVHSALHEACHFICMDAARRSTLHTDAGGDYDEENAVCFLQILLADELPGFDRSRMLADMDAWGYSFRLGSARAWFERDADDAQAWLLAEGLIDSRGRLRWRLRGTATPVGA